MLKGKVAVVTGGTRGIGYAIVKKYLENGAKVVLFGSREETVEKALASLKAENPGWVVEGAHPNLSNAGEMAKAIEDVKEKYGRLDILVNNAGVSDSTKIDNYFSCSAASRQNHERTGRRLYLKYQLHGQYIRAARRHSLPHQ